MTKTNDTTPGIDSAFLTVLQHHRSGQILSDLSQAMREATEAARKEAKKSTIVLKIDIKPAGKVPGAFIIQDDVKVTLPKPEKKESFFFADDQGTLHRTDPNQRELPLKMIDGGQPVEVETLKRAATV